MIDCNNNDIYIVYILLGTTTTIVLVALLYLLQLRLYVIRSGTKGIQHEIIKASQPVMERLGSTVLVSNIMSSV